MSHVHSAACGGRNGDVRHAHAHPRQAQRAVIGSIVFLLITLLACSRPARLTLTQGLEVGDHLGLHTTFLTADGKVIDERAVEGAVAG